jgi:hypothetical protein
VRFSLIGKKSTRKIGDVAQIRYSAIVKKELFSVTQRRGKERFTWVVEMDLNTSYVAKVRNSWELNCCSQMERSIG